MINNSRIISQNILSVNSPDLVYMLLQFQLNINVLISYFRQHFHAFKFLPESREVADSCRKSVLCFRNYPQKSQRKLRNILWKMEGKRREVGRPLAPAASAAVPVQLAPAGEGPLVRRRRLHLARGGWKRSLWFPVVAPSRLYRSRFCK